MGKGDGTAGGKRYFECEARCGAFARPHNVTVGDFPELDIFASDDEDADAGGCGGCGDASCGSKAAAGDAASDDEI